VAVDGITGAFSADRDAVSLRDLNVRVGETQLQLDGSLEPASAQGAVRAAFLVDALDPAALDPRLDRLGPVWARGSVAGTLEDPSLSMQVRWSGIDGIDLGDPLELSITARRGMVEVDVAEWRTVAGPLSATATIPVGGLPRPDWLWPDAPTAEARARLTGIALSSGPLVEALGYPSPPADATGDLELNLSWDLTGGAGPHAELELNGFSIAGELIDLGSVEPIRGSLSDNRIRLETVTLTGPRGRAEVGGVYDLVNGEVVAAADIKVDGQVLEILPFPLQARGPLHIQMAVEGDPARPTASLIVDHRGGTIVARDPAVEITDLTLHVEVDDNVAWIQDGEAGVNLGKMWLGGGWDPQTSQGIVLEFEDVNTIVGTSIVTEWSGVVAMEPDPRHPARIVGEVVLGAGIWERPFDLRQAFFGASAVDAEEDSPLDDVALDLQVAGFGGVRVDNNLGRFNASWGILEVAGTVGQPELIGTVRLSPGGTVNLPGKVVVIRRATLDFTGNPATDPVIDIVPENFNVVFGGDGADGTGVDATALAAETLARSAGSILGFENTTLQPAQIAFETQTDASSAFTAGRRLTRNVAVFFTTDLSDVQSQTTMLQLWNLRGLPGLALQGYNRTGDEERGGNLIQRYRWGGGREADDRPVINALRLDGEWPVGGRRMRRATGLRKGEPYGPFLLFAAGLRLEAALAEHGYPRARVTAEAVGDERSPTLVFTVVPGPLQSVVFAGDPLPSHIRRAVRGGYRPPPVETTSLAEMRRTALRHLFSEQYPDAEVEVFRRGDEIVVDVSRGAEIPLQGPQVHGLDPADAAALSEDLATPVLLADFLRNRARAERTVSRWLELEGFPNGSLEDVWTEDHENGRTVHLRVTPGERRRVSSIEVSGDDPLGLTADGVPGLEAGMPLNRRAVSRELTRVRSAYRRAGYTEVLVSTEVSESGQLRIRLEPGSKRAVRSISVEGLRYIRESVIRNGLTIEPGEVLLPEDLDTSATRTAYFSPVERADVTTREVGINLADVTVEVEEKKRWMVEAGAGWSTERGTNLQFGWSDQGLLGRGAGLSIRGERDDRQRQAGIWVSLPPLPGGRWSTVANFFWFDGDARENPERFSDQRLGGAIETTYKVNPSTSIRGYLRTVQSEQDVKDPDDILAGFYPIETQETVVGTIGIWDRLDNPFDPQSGLYAAADLSRSAPSLGSDFDDIRLVLTGLLVNQPRTDWVWTQAIRLGAAHPFGDTIMSTEREFYAGGQATIRGFDLDSVSPLSPAGTPKGGNALFVLNEELAVPVWSGFGLAAFVDVGQVWETWSDATFDLAVGTGFGLRYRTPVGPLWADVAWPVANLGVSSPGAKYYFGFGTKF
jgi:translocation and assembly module TamA